ncbi:Riboflavin biosynthesis protein RibD,bifunctional diaminohydroxyphosphoribosylaminopyrimidine deaminase/5-amino-6-(5-phosphoribosylamino)uracil reductase,Pyrimidine deaminase,riboflavin biosynthesis protein RibD,RibD C-terminal domain [Chlamydia serpentis]|uniref:Riboflavin biosynthesis protein RibD n=1 Tax=Chlamydia serpentis TaxID=1967782 RepID=A0A2R8FC50_9CHLA|nr:bifunctional diaminohydroxyphosphoribosylaminopyrimidine deaminase/5-amino-6-(5-phosphoribosylamino)uracil reductase RibD [Chlamydia serpentis]SPN73983.1 Riboflavin biosynthesis protein RibD,bifunctional diaminohydroxyphosphoribosylaminopyrimidine deaminase/5-amino-6-(5-phosphoribosylamino)uracil reductase,Pyrimidine deaminase,riboflavin biosynthesis protein RibD,RibD C-terminal domain [Chlamydia serpentis]
MEDFSEQQLFFMRRAIEIGERGRITAPPNPWIGCVIVKENRILGEGFHAYPGGPHAEEVAINNASESVFGSDVYVSLEPCSHYGLRPPCANLLIKHKIKRVFVSLVDPDPKVAGHGIKILRQAGIQVYVGIGETEAYTSLQPYLYQRTYNRPWIILKSAASIDGQIADSQGKSQWITCPEARNDVGKLRAESQAILAGSRTVRFDNPWLTARQPSGSLYSRQPLRVVLDSYGNIPYEFKVFDKASPTLYVTTTRCPKNYIKILEGLGIEVLITELTSSGVDLHHLYDYLANKKILQILVEGGANLHTSLLKEKLVNSVILYSGPMILGDQKKPLIGSLGALLDSAYLLKPRRSQILGNSLKVIWETLPNFRDAIRN